MEALDVYPLREEQPRLSRLGFHIVPIIPPNVQHAGAGKAPGHFMAGGWSGLPKWQRFRDAKPGPSDLALWGETIPGANIGIVCGTDAGDGLVVFAVDIDTEDADEFDAIMRATPNSPMEKRGHKGVTRFYRASPDLRSKSYNLDGGRRVVDLLTGNQTRQTVAPPSLHPKGMRYRWIVGPVEAHRLPEFTAADLDRLEDTLAAMGWQGKTEEQESARAAAVQRIESGFANDWDTAKTVALANLRAWVPALNLYRLRPARAGYACVNIWRPSSTGQPNSARKRNLSIQPEGIKDFGTGETFTPIDLVMRALGLDESAALNWLEARLGLARDPSATIDAGAMLANAAGRKTRQAPRAMSPETAAAMPWRREDGFENFANPDALELPEHLTSGIPGLVGGIADFICKSSRFPQPGFAVGAALSIVAAAAGQRYGSPTLTGTQIYVIALAETSAGKNQSLKFVKQVLIGAGLESRCSGWPKSWNAIFSILVKNSAVVFPMDEIGKFLERINSPKAAGHEAGITTALLELWGQGFETFLPPQGVMQQDPSIFSPRLSLYGVSTPKAFYSALRASDASSGLLNRFLLISTRKKPAERDPECELDDFPGEYLDTLAEIADAQATPFAQVSRELMDRDAKKPGRGMRKISTRPPIVATYGDGAEDEWKALKKEIEGRGESGFATEFYGRTAEMAQRLALLRAIGVDHAKPVIDRACMKWACELALWSADRLFEEASANMAENPWQADRKRIMRAIMESEGGKIGRRPLGYLLDGVIQPRARMEMVRDLIDCGDLETVTEGGVEYLKPTELGLAKFKRGKRK